MHKQIRTIAFYTLLEALRNRLVWLVGALALAALGLSGLLDSLAITESRQVQAAMVAALARAGAVFIMATFVVTSMGREASDKGLELLLAQALPRAAYLFGKLLGYGAIALLPALLLGALMLLWAAPQQVAAWTLSLACELWIVAGFALLCSLTFKNVVSALSAVLATYLAARSVTTMALLAQSPGDAPALSQQVAKVVFDVLGNVLPHLDRYTRTEWLVYPGAAAAEIPAILAQSVICLALIGGVALFDLYRKNI